ncbi:conserved repeat domain-containing protein [Microlunatus sagamiharensis]|uniref:Conserved repeat domain-containing protein n=1 Tax=Microlunatus sagamiharensis TaxID=546874 RepID=A0A1H2M7G8_9ACTN|nr:Ig-like domain-containing protein [Microlunatus sagamiharensis]SDU88955.1 conserved repeat domain-containing protein [Microlunatus sagamiharensis]
MKKAWGATAAAVAAGLVMAAVPGAAQAAERTVVVPGDFVKALSDTRATGHYEVVGSGLRIYTTGSTGTDKVAEYVASNAPLAVVGEPSLDYSSTFGTIPPGFQLVVDDDADGIADGILIGEKVYDGDWWASGGSKQFVKDGAPSHDPGSGSANHGTLDQWRASFPKAQVLAFGFSLGSGVYGDWTIDAISYAGDRYTFSDKVPDTTPPVVTCDVAAPGPSFAYGTTGEVTASVTDADSGVSSPTVSAAAATGSVGAKTVTLTVTDDAGNPASQTCPYTVVAGAPASVTVVSGTGQSAPVGTAFAQPVKVRVADAGDNPVANVPVTFTAPTTGASGSFMGGSVVTDADGVAAVTVTATGGTGTWTGSASVTGVSKAATFSLTNTAAPAKRADLRVSLTGPAQLSKGQAGSYVLTVTNVGPDAATDVLSSLALPCGVSITSTGGGARVGNLVVWPTLKSLASGSSTSYTVTVKATAKGTWKAVGGAASLKTADPALTNNLAATTVSVH